jgi:DNA-binding GntR family transcriptional regulator
MASGRPVWMRQNKARAAGCREFNESSRRPMITQIETGLPFAVPSANERPFYRNLAKAIRDSIRDGTLREGDCLPPRGRIARAAGVNVSSVGRAINLLIREQLLVTNWNGGRVRVRSWRPAAELRPVRRPNQHLRISATVKVLEARAPDGQTPRVMVEETTGSIAMSPAMARQMGLEVGQTVEVDIAWRSPDRRG